MNTDPGMNTEPSMNTEVVMVQCRNCRAFCDGSFHFCGRCGQRLHSASPTLSAEPAFASPYLAMQPAKQRWWQERINVVIMACLCLLLISGSFLAVVSMRAASQTTKASSSVSGVAWYYDLRAQSDGFALHLVHLSALAQGKVYVGWLLNPHRPDQILATGPLAVASDGSSTFLSEQLPTFNSNKLDLRLLFTQVMVTIEQANMSPQRPGTQILLSGAIPQSVVTDTLLLFVGTSYTPQRVALLSGLRSQMRELARWIANMHDVQIQQNRDAVQADLLRILYIIEGAHGNDVQSLHILSLANIQHEGDGFGLIAPARCSPTPCGYLDALQGALQLLLKHHALDPRSAQKIQITLATMDQLARAMQQRALQLAHLTTFDAATTQSLFALATLSDALLNGRDLNGDGSIDPVPGEAAAAQLYAYLQQLGVIALSTPSSSAQ